jgi:hypothetical protein
MQRIYIFIICSIAGIIGTSVSMVFQLHWSCMIGTIIFVVAIALSLDTYFKDRRENEAKLYAELTKRKKTIKVFEDEFGVDFRRAERLYTQGFHSLIDFKNKSVQDLMEIDDINPTLAKRIVETVRVLD